MNKDKKAPLGEAGKHFARVFVKYIQYVRAAYEMPGTTQKQLDTLLQSLKA